MKPLTRLATALYINELLQTKCDNFTLATGAFKEVSTCYDRITSYKTQHLLRVDKEIGRLIVRNAFVNNDWDFTIFSDVEKFAKFIRKFGFLRVFDKYSGTYQQSDTDKRILTNMMYVMLKHQKINNALMDSYHLTKNEETIDYSEEAHQEVEKILETV